jgi:8-oxo-dGTP diphosphatase
MTFIYCRRRERLMDRPLVGIGVIVRNEGRVLVLKRKGSHGEGTWAPPGGHLEYGESIEDCARRETLEETGVAIGNVRFFALTNDVMESEQKHYLTVWVEGDYVSGEAKVAYPEKVAAVAWVAEDALPEPLFDPFHNLVSGKQYPGSASFSSLRLS